MSRDAEEGYRTYMELYNKGIELVFLRERHIDTASYRDSVEQLGKVMGQELHIKDEDIGEMIQAIMKALDKVPDAYVGTEYTACIWAGGKGNLSVAYCGSNVCTPDQSWMKKYYVIASHR